VASLIVCWGIMEQKTLLSAVKDFESLTLES